MKPLEVDCFEIDIETLFIAGGNTHDVFAERLTQDDITELVIKNLTQESKERFEEYQKQNDPCSKE